MKKSEAFLACGAAVLTIASLTVTRANKKYANGSRSAYFKNVTSSITLFKGIIVPSGAVMHLTILVNAGHTAFFKTASSSDHTMYADVALTQRLYYK